MASASKQSNQADAQQVAVDALEEHWRIDVGTTIVLLPRRWQMSRRASLTAHLLLYVGGAVYLTIMITMANILSPVHVVTIAITAIVLPLAAIVQMQPVIEQIRLEPEVLTITWRGVLRPSETTMRRDRMTYAYGHSDRPVDGTTKHSLAIGYRGVTGPVIFEFPSDVSECQAFAMLIRCFYQLAIFPPSASPEDDAYCPRCHYDMRGSAMAGHFNCPECGTMMEPWQIESCKALQLAEDLS